VASQISLASLTGWLDTLGTPHIDRVLFATKGSTMLRAVLTALLRWTVIACFLPAVADGQVPVSPDYTMQLMLTRNTLALVNHGNLTGNYTVLRDLASDRLRRSSTASDLAATFASLRQQKLDLSPVLVIEPQFAESPREIAPGRLLLVGQFPTQPRSVRFALVFQQVAEGWLIDEISIDVTQPPTITNSAPATRPPREEMWPSIRGQN
jgi:hypothetical protein